jgi:hypothetical protein
MSTAQSAFLSIQFLPEFFEAFEMDPELPVLHAGVLIKVRARRTPSRRLLPIATTKTKAGKLSQGTPKGGQVCA